MGNEFSSPDIEIWKVKESYRYGHVPVFNGASFENKVVGRKLRGTEFEVAERVGNWLRLTDYDESWVPIFTSKGEPICKYKWMKQKDSSVSEEPTYMDLSSYQKCANCERPGDLFKTTEAGGAYLCSKCYY